MSPSFSRRSLVVGGAAAMGAVALPAGVGGAVAADAPSAGIIESLPAVFDPRAFVEDLLSTGHEVSLQQPVRWSGDPDEDLTPSYFVHPQPDGRFTQAYSQVMTRWARRLEVTPDHVEQVVRYAFGEVDGGTLRNAGSNRR